MERVHLNGADIEYTVQVADGRALLRHLGITRAHIAGGSYGAVIALQWALDGPEEVQSVALLEPPLTAAVPSGPAFDEGVAAVRRELYECGDRVGATTAFVMGVMGPNYREVIARSLPPGAFELAVADLDTFFQVELPALQAWRFTAQDAARLRPPVLSVLGTASAPMFSEGHAVLQEWIPQTEELLVPQATHGLEMTSPRLVADGMAHFLVRHKF